MIQDLALITLIVVYLVDLSGGVSSLKQFIWKHCLDGKGRYPYSFRLRPLDCSLCLTWWTGLVYLWITQEFSLENVALVAMFSYFTSQLASLLRLVSEMINNVLRWILMSDSGFRI